MTIEKLSGVHRKGKKASSVYGWGVFSFSADSWRQKKPDCKWQQNALKTLSITYKITILLLSRATDSIRYAHKPEHLLSFGVWRVVILSAIYCTPQSIFFNYKFFFQVSLENLPKYHKTKQKNKIPGIDWLLIKNSFFFITLSFKAHFVLFLFKSSLAQLSFKSIEVNLYMKQG